MDHWACYREIMYIHLMCEGSSLLFNIICSVLDVKSFYLSRQQHLNQLDTAVRYLTYRMCQHEVSVMSSLVKSWLTDLVKSWLTDLWNCFWMIVYLYRISCGSSLLFNKICSVLDAKSFYLSHQQHLNQLEAAVRYLTYMIYLHVISVMIGVMLTLTTQYHRGFVNFLAKFSQLESLYGFTNMEVYDIIISVSVSMHDFNKIIIIISILVFDVWQLAHHNQYQYFISMVAMQLIN